MSSADPSAPLAFVDVATLSATDVLRIIVGLEAVHCSLRPANHHAYEIARIEAIRDRINVTLRLRAKDGDVRIPRSDGLDLAVGLLEVAELLHRDGRNLEALALEGMEGRILESLVGSDRLGAR